MPSEVFEFELNGRPTEVMAGPLATVSHVLRAARAAGGQDRLPTGRLRLVHGDGRRRARALLPAARGERRRAVGYDLGRVGGRPAAAHLPRALRGAVRLLRARDADGGARCSIATIAVARGDREAIAGRVPLRAISRSSIDRCIGGRRPAVSFDRGSGRPAEVTRMSTLSQQPFHVIGRGVERRDGLGHVTGTTEYIDDVRYPGMLHLKMVRNPLVTRRSSGSTYRRRRRCLASSALDRCRRAEERLHDPLPDRGRAGRGAVLASERVPIAASRSWLASSETEAAAVEAVKRFGSTWRSCRGVRRRGGAQGRTPRGSRTGTRTTSGTRAITAGGSATATRPPRELRRIT